ncbi:uncharacterized protein [Dysidea avara]|uniref:uncharacterized protein isoform X2 n=1 Tax=Dysidea avara TaxID=196820 RepID=UPI00332AF3F1
MGTVVHDLVALIDGKERPPLKDMANHIVPKWASTWKELGVHLNIEDHLLRNIEKDFSNDCEGSCSKMLQEWLDMNRNASWEVLIDALDKLAENAREVQKLQQVQPSIMDLPKSPRRPKSPSNTKSPSCCGTDSKKSIECDLKNQAITKLKVKYIKVVNKIKQTMEEKHFDVDELIMNLSAADEDNHTVFSTDVAYNTIKTIPDLFKKIGQYCSVYDYELLQVLVESVDCEEAIKLLEGFTEELNNSIINELDLLRIFQEQPKPTQLMPGTHKLVIKYTGNICTLPMKNMIQRVVFECFKLKPGSVILRGIEEGCIALIYQISAAVKSYLLHYKLGHQEFTLLATHKIKCVIVDGTEIQVPPEFLEKANLASVTQITSRDADFKKNMLSAQLDKIAASLSPEDLEATLSTLRTIFDNIIQHPNDDKYRQIKLANKTFSSKVWRYPACEELMKMSGWVEEDDHVRLRDATHLQTVHSAICERIGVPHEPSGVKVKDLVTSSAATGSQTTSEVIHLLSKQLEKVIACLHPDDRRATLKTLKECFKNIFQHPNDDKYRQIKLANKTFSSKVWRYPACEELMKMSGWVVEDDHVRLKDDSRVRIMSDLLNIAYRQECPKQATSQTGVLSVEQFQALIKAVFSKDIVKVDGFLQKCGITNAGRVFCEDDCSVNLLFAAIITQQIELAQLLFDYYDVDSYEIDGFCADPKPCAYAMFEHASDEFIIEMMSVMPYIDVCSKYDGYTILHAATMANSLDVISFLTGDNFNFKLTTPDDHLGRTPLHTAFLSGNTKIAQCLMDSGADTSLKDMCFCTPLDYRIGDPKMIADSHHLQNQRTIRSDPFSIEHNYYLKLVKTEMDPKDAVSVTMTEYPTLINKIVSVSRHDDRDHIVKELAEYLIQRPATVALP